MDDNKNFDWNQYLDLFKEVTNGRNKSEEAIEEDYFFKETLADKDRTGWIILEEYTNTTVNSINLISVPEAWCGVEFKINVISIGATNLILGSPELDEYPIDREELIKIIKLILEKKFIKTSFTKIDLDDHYWTTVKDNSSIIYDNKTNTINWMSGGSLLSSFTLDTETNGLCRD